MKMTIEDCVNEGWDVSIFNDVRRMEGSRGHREFLPRICWKATRRSQTIESAWEGFETAEEAIADLLNRLIAEL